MKIGQEIREEKAGNEDSMTEERWGRWNERGKVDEQNEG